jgi:3-hydroxy-5-methyl-1-naphthoate 3-O-methyltransferase
MPTWWTGLAEAPLDEAQALHALGLGFMAARTLHVALELRLFTHLAARAQPLVQVAQTLGLAERAAGRLLHACAALGLVQATGGMFRNTPLTQKYLVEGQPTFIGSYLRMFDALSYHRWEQMGAALRHNGPVDDISHPYRYLADDAEDAATFAAAQHAGSRSLGHALAHRVDFRPFACLLDLGGGSGAYTVEILHCYPHLRAILFDFPQVGRLAETVMRQERLTDRVQIVGGDYEHDVLPPGPDVVLWSGNLHASSPESCRRVLTELHALLPPGGMVLIHDYMLDDTRSGPLIPALLALHLTLVSEDGQVYSGAELRHLLAQAGFGEVRIEPFLTGHSSLVIAQRG